MSNIEKIRSLNEDIEIFEIDNINFTKYGQKLNINLNNFYETAKENIEIPKVDVLYKASVKDLEDNSEDKALVENYVYGQMEAQIGICTGQNSKMNAMEFHKGSEVIVAITDIILLLGNPEDIEIENENWKYDSKKCEAFFMKSGDIVELYPRILHFSPIQVSKKGFKAIIILPKNTNTELDKSVGKTKYLAAKNKWLFMHNDIPYGKKGIYGNNIEIHI